MRRCLESPATIPAVMPSRLVSNWGETAAHTHGRQCLCCVQGHSRKPVRAQGSCAPPPARGQPPRLRRTAGPGAAHAHRLFRAAGPRASLANRPPSPRSRAAGPGRGTRHWLARAPRAQGCRARALACARARAQGGTYVGGTRASVRARAHPPHLTCASGLTVWFKFKRHSIDSVVQIQAPIVFLGAHGVEIVLHLAKYGLMKLVPIYMFSVGAGTKT